MDLDRDQPALLPESPGVGLRLGLRARLLVPVLLALIPAYILLVWNAVEEREASAQRARWRSFSMLSASVAEMDRLVDSTSQLLQTLAEVPEIRRLDPVLAQAMLEDLVARRPGYHLEITDAWGGVVASAGPPEEAEPPPLAAGAGMALQAERSGRGLLRCSWPLRGGRGTVWAAVNLNWLNRRLAASDLPEGSEVSLADPRGTVVLHHPDPRLWVGRTVPGDLVRPSEGQSRRGVERPGLDGVLRLYRSASLRGSDGDVLGTLSFGIPLDAGKAEAEAALALNLALLTLVAVISLTVAWLGGEWLLLRRLRVLSRTVQRLAHLEMSARTGLGHHADEVGRLAWSFDVMAERLQAARQRERQAHAHLLHAAQEKKAFYREVLRTVTGGRFHLVDRDSVPTEGVPVLSVGLEGDGYAEVRDALRHLATEVGLDAEGTGDLLVLFGEAASNAIKHGVDGRCTVFLVGDRIRVRVTDRGPGIQLERLPATLFESGYSTRVSLGMGYTLMLRLADAVWLATGPDGTVLQVEKAVGGATAEEDLLEALVARF